MSKKSTPKIKTKANPRNGAWSKKIIASRSKSKKWYDNMMAGRTASKKNPTAMKLLREQRGWRQADLAAFTGTETPTITRIERGHSPVKKDVASKIAAKLGVPVAKIFAPKGKKLVAVFHKSQI